MQSSKLAVPELAAVEVRGVTRSAFILRSALAAGAVYGGAAVGPFVRQALGQAEMGQREGAGDVEILNFALTLEVLENGFYEMALKQVKGLSRDVKRLATTIRDNEAAHVGALTKTIRDLGGKPAAAPKLDFGDAFGSEDSFLELAQTLEDTGVSAYNGAGPQIQDKKVLAAAGSIVQVEARHAAAIRLERGEEIAPAAFDETLEQQEVLEQVEPFIRS